MTPHEMSNEVQRLVALIDDGISVMRKQSVALAEAEMVYRKAKADAWVQCPTDVEGKREWTAGRPGEQYMDWGCSGCRAAWVTAVMNGINPKDAPRHYEKGREVADRVGDPHFSRAVAMLGLRVST